MIGHVSLIGADRWYKRGDVYIEYTSHGPIRYLVVRVNSQYVMTVRPYSRFWAAVYRFERWWQGLGGQ